MGSLLTGVLAHDDVCAHIQPGLDVLRLHTWTHGHIAANGVCSSAAWAAENNAGHSGGSWRQLKKNWQPILGPLVAFELIIKSVTAKVHPSKTDLFVPNRNRKSRTLQDCMESATSVTACRPIWASLSVFRAHQLHRLAGNVFVNKALIRRASSVLVPSLALQLRDSLEVKV